MTVGQALLAIFGTAYLAWVLVYSKVFEFGRTFVDRTHRRFYRRHARHGLARHRAGAFVFGKLNQLLICPFCAGFWIVVGCQLIFRWNVFGGSWIGVGLTGVGITMPAALLALATGRLTKSVRREQDALDLPVPVFQET